MNLKKTDKAVSNTVIFVPLFGLLIIWLVYWIEVKLGVNFKTYGIYPRQLKGLWGIVCSPFLHGSKSHLYSNTLPFALLTAATFYFYQKQAWRLIGYGTLISGLLTWCFAREAYHIGASGLIYIMFGFLLFKGLISGQYRLVALSLAVVFFYGSMLWYIFPIVQGISWEGHLFGLLTGLLFAILLKSPTAVHKKYEWEKEDYKEEEDDFMRCFDKDGNFIEQEEVKQFNHNTLNINYEYLPDDSPKD